MCAGGGGHNCCLCDGGSEDCGHSLPGNQRRCQFALLPLPSPLIPPPSSPPPSILITLPLPPHLSRSILWLFSSPSSPHIVTSTHNSTRVLLSLTSSLSGQVALDSSLARWDIALPLPLPPSPSLTPVTCWTLLGLSFCQCLSLWL